jgi:D-amino-acid dehydrogenase
MHEPGSIAVIGAGVIGAAVACALAREGRSVVLIDRSEPGVAGASYGNAGHIATEVVEPLPSPALLFGFWRQLVAFGGPLDIPLRRLPAFAPWAARFATAAFNRRAHTAQLAPLVKAAAITLEHWLKEMHRSELLRRRGHYELWLNGRAQKEADAHARAMDRLAVRTLAAPTDLLRTVQTAAHARSVGGLWFPDSAYVVDPLELVRAFVGSAVERGAKIVRADVAVVRPATAGVEVVAEAQSIAVSAAVICAGVWSTRLLAPLGLKAPLESVRGYHIEIPGGAPFADAPLVYSNEHVIVTPMAGRLRASSYMEFLPPEAPGDGRKPYRLRQKLRALGYACDPQGPSWVGARPALPDYLPGIGSAAGANIFYAIGHQHIGVTLAAVTGELIADLVARREPRRAIGAFDLVRFGTSTGQ